VKISRAGIDFIKTFEELRLEAYQDEAGVWTIGWGHTQGVHEGDECTEEEAEEMLKWDLADAEQAVNQFVDVDLHLYEYDALVSFTFNCGTEALRSSTLLRLLNNGDRNGAALQFKRWNRSGGHVSNGLVRRRAEEAKMFRGGEEQ
jgi:lysozyme